MGGTPQPIGAGAGRDRLVDQDARSEGEVFGRESLQLPPDAYLVVAEDVEGFYSRFVDRTIQVVAPERWVRLNDSGDAVVVRDATGDVMDRMVYDHGAFAGRVARTDFGIRVER